MRKEKNNANSSEKQDPFMKVVEPTVDLSHVEFEIERHVKSIRALIQKLRPMERQRYYDGLLSHLLSQPVNYPFSKTVTKNCPSNYSNLSATELTLVRDLSLKIEELYRHSDNEMNN